MEYDLSAPVCLSKCFVNKFGVRSTSNSAEVRALKTCNILEFLKRILEDTVLPEQNITSLSCDLSVLLVDLKRNIRNACKTDFKEYFRVHPGSATSRSLIPVNKSKIADSCCLVLLNILPSYFFGHPNNIRLFKRQVCEIVYSMRGQHTILSNCLKKWRLDCITWCEPVALDNRRILVYKILLWIYKHVLSMIILVNFYVTTTECTNDDTKLFYFSKSQWQSFHDRSLRSMLTAGTLSAYQLYSKKRHINFSPLERHQSKQFVKSIPKLYIVLKNAGKFRPIVRYKSQKKRDKKVKERISLLRLLNNVISPPRDSLDVQYTKLFQKWSELKRPKLYFVRADLTNAFGSIDRKVLLKILSHCHKTYQEKERNAYLKKKVATEYRALARELQSPLLVRCGSTVYEWRNGLVQGLKFSPALSEIYYGYLDQHHFAETLKTESFHGQIVLFRRVVDDYLYVSDSLDGAVRFLHDLRKYDNLNHSKTMTNFIFEDMRVSQDVTFLGYIYDTLTLEVSRSPDVLGGQACYKTTFTPGVADLVKFTEKRIGQSSVPIDGHIFNLHYNSEKSIWVHSFAVFCLAANKFCTILSVQCKQDDITVKYLNTYKKEVGVKLCSAIVDTVIKNKPTDVKYYYCINHFRHMAYKALLLCAMNTKKCTALVPQIKILTAKTNCTVGKWREHACCIARDGVKTKMAVVEVCKRSDFRMFLWSCDSLPVGFECYNGHLEEDDK